MYGNHPHPSLELLECYAVMLNFLFHTFYFKTYGSTRRNTSRVQHNTNNIVGRHQHSEAESTRWTPPCPCLQDSKECLHEANCQQYNTHARNNKHSYSLSPNKFRSSLDTKQYEKKLKTIADSVNKNPTTCLESKTKTHNF